MLDQDRVVGHIGAEHLNGGEVVQLRLLELRGLEFLLRGRVAMRVDEADLGGNAEEVDCEEENLLHEA